MPTAQDWKLSPYGNHLRLAAVDEPTGPPSDPPDDPQTPVLTIDQQLKAWTIAQAWTWTAVTLDTNTTDLIASATVTWPHNSSGVYTLLAADTSLYQWDVNGGRKLTPSRQAGSTPGVNFHSSLT